MIWNRLASNCSLYLQHSSNVDSLHDHRFFFEVRPIEELQGSKTSPRREEVGRRTLGAFGGFLLAFFYRASFGFFTQQIPLFVDKPQKLSLGFLLYSRTSTRTKC